MDEENRSGKLPENSEEAKFTESELRYDDYTDYEDFERRERARRARYVQNYEGTGAGNGSRRRNTCGSGSC